MSVNFEYEYCLVENLNHIENNSHYVPIIIFDKYIELVKIFDYKEERKVIKQLEVKEMLKFGINPLENWVNDFEKYYTLE